MLNTLEPKRRPIPERAVATLMVPALLAIAMTAGVFVVRSGDAVSRSARAQAGADATALAAVSGGRAAAVSVASANGATVLELRDDDGILVATVSRSGIEAVAAATWERDG